MFYKASAWCLSEKVLCSTKKVCGCCLSGKVAKGNERSLICLSRADLHPSSDMELGNFPVKNGNFSDYDDFPVSETL